MTRAPAGWALWHRHAEGGEWRLVLTTGRALHLHDEVKAPTFERAHGDLVVTCAPGGGRRAFWVVTGDDRLVATGPVPRSLPRPSGPRGPWEWERAWAEASGEDLARIGQGVDPRRLVRSVVESLAVATLDETTGTVVPCTHIPAVAKGAGLRRCRARVSTRRSRLR